MPEAGYRAKDYTEILRALVEAGGELPLPHPAIRGYGPSVLARRRLGKWLRDSSRSMKATGYVITDLGRAALAQSEEKK